MVTKIKEMADSNMSEQSELQSHPSTSEYHVNEQKQQEALGQIGIPEKEKTREEVEKEMRLREAVLTRKQKHDAMMRERARIKAQIKLDRLELVEDLSHPHAEKRDSHLRQSNVEKATHSELKATLKKKQTDHLAAAREEPVERIDTLQEATIARKQKQKELMKEKARILAQIKQDRLEYEARQGKHTADHQLSEAVVRNEKKGSHSLKSTALQHASKRRIADISKIDDYIATISTYKVGGYGGKCLKILSLYLKNILDHPHDEKYQEIKMDNKIYRTKVKPFIGAKMLLLATGFSVDESKDALVLENNPNFYILEETAQKLRNAHLSYLNDSH